MPSRRRLESAAFAGPRRSSRKASVGPAAGPDASTASAPAGSGPHNENARRERHRQAGPVTTSLAFVIPTRNRAEFAIRAAAALLDQGHRDVRVVISDN